LRFIDRKGTVEGGHKPEGVRLRKIRLRRTGVLLDRGANTGRIYEMEAAPQELSR
jgi:hypothetical protein